MPKKDKKVLTDEDIKMLLTATNFKPEEIKDWHAKFLVSYIVKVVAIICYILFKERFS